MTNLEATEKRDEKAGEAGKPAPWSLDDLEFPDLGKRHESADINDEALKLSGRIGGLVPVQGEGELDGKPWYFRARYEHWTFTMAEVGGNVHQVRSMFHNAALEDGWNIEKDWPFGAFSAGYMPIKTAVGLIRACARLYRAGKLPHVVADAEKYAEESKSLQQWAEAIRFSSYCDCSHNQPDHGIGKEAVKAEPTEGKAEALPFWQAPRGCEKCECRDFHYSAEETTKHRGLSVGDQPDDATTEA